MSDLNVQYAVLSLAQDFCKIMSFPDLPDFTSSTSLPVLQNVMSSFTSLNVTLLDLSISLMNQNTSSTSFATLFHPNYKWLKLMLDGSVDSIPTAKLSKSVRVDFSKPVNERYFDLVQAVSYRNKKWKLPKKVYEKVTENDNLSVMSTLYLIESETKTLKSRNGVFTCIPLRDSDQSKALYLSPALFHQKLLFMINPMKGTATAPAAAAVGPRILGEEESKASLPGDLESKASLPGERIFEAQKSTSTIPMITTPAIPGTPAIPEQAPKEKVLQRGIRQRQSSKLQRSNLSTCLKGLALTSIVGAGAYKGIDYMTSSAAATPVKNVSAPMYGCPSTGCPAFDMRTQCSLVAPSYPPSFEEALALPEYLNVTGAEVEAPPSYLQDKFQVKRERKHEKYNLKQIYVPDYLRQPAFPISIVIKFPLFLNRTENKYEGNPIQEIPAELESIKDSLNNILVNPSGGNPNTIAQKVTDIIFYADKYQTTYNSASLLSFFRTRLYAVVVTNTLNTETSVTELLKDEAYKIQGVKIPEEPSEREVMKAFLGQMETIKKVTSNTFVQYLCQFMTTNRLLNKDDNIRSFINPLIARNPFVNMTIDVLTESVLKKLVLQNMCNTEGWSLDTNVNFDMVKQKLDHVITVYELSEVLSRVPITKHSGPMLGVNVNEDLQALTQLLSMEKRVTQTAFQMYENYVAYFKSKEPPMSFYDVSTALSKKYKHNVLYFIDPSQFLTKPLLLPPLSLGPEVTLNQSRFLDAATLLNNVLAVTYDAVKEDHYIPPQMINFVVAASEEFINRLEPALQGTTPLVKSVIQEIVNKTTILLKQEFPTLDIVVVMEKALTTYFPKPVVERPVEAAPQKSFFSSWLPSFLSSEANATAGATSNLTLPAANVTAATSNLTLPETNATATAANLTLPVTNATAATSNLTLPVTNATAATSNLTLPAPNATAATSNVTLPSRNATAATSNVTLPSRNATGPSQISEDIEVEEKVDTFESEAKESQVALFAQQRKLRDEDEESLGLSYEMKPQYDFSETTGLVPFQDYTQEYREGMVYIDSLKKLYTLVSNNAKKLTRDQWISLLSIPIVRQSVFADIILSNLEQELTRTYGYPSWKIHGELSEEDLKKFNDFKDFLSKADYKPVRVTINSDSSIFLAECLYRYFYFENIYTREEAPHQMLSESTAFINEVNQQVEAVKPVLQYTSVKPRKYFVKISKSLPFQLFSREVQRLNALTWGETASQFLSSLSTGVGKITGWFGSTASEVGRTAADKIIYEKPLSPGQRTIQTGAQQ